MRANGVLRPLLWTSLILVVSHSLLRTEPNRTNVRDFAVAVAEVWKDRSAVLERLATPRSGERKVLPRRVLAMLYLLEKNGVETYRYSEKIGEIALTRQRLIEASWPRRFDPDAAFVLSYIVERDAAGSMQPGCEEVDSIDVLDATLGISLARCR